MTHETLLAFNPLSSLDFNLLLTDPNDEMNTVPSPYDLNNLNSLYWKTEDLANHIAPQETNTFFTLEYSLSSREI